MSDADDGGAPKYARRRQRVHALPAGATLVLSSAASSRRLLLLVQAFIDMLISLQAENTTSASRGSSSSFSWSLVDWQLRCPRPLSGRHWSGALRRPIYDTEVAAHVIWSRGVL